MGIKRVLINIAKIQM